MRQYIGMHDTPTGAKFAREDYLKNHPKSMVIVGYDSRNGYYLDIIEPTRCEVIELKPKLRTVK